MRAIALAIAIAFVLAVAGPALDDHGAEMDAARALEDAQREAAARARFERAAQYICGPQSPWSEVAQGVIQCFTKRGRPTLRATVHKE